MPFYSLQSENCSFISFSSVDTNTLISALFSGFDFFQNCLLFQAPPWISPSFKVLNHMLWRPKEFTVITFLSCDKSGTVRQGNCQNAKMKNLCESKCGISQSNASWCSRNQVGRWILDITSICYCLQIELLQVCRMPGMVGPYVCELDNKYRARV